MNIIFNWIHGHFQQTVQGGYKWYVAAFLLKNSTLASAINFIKEGSVNYNFSDILFFCIESVKHARQQGQAIKSLFQMSSV